jgi:hypothetical protein
MLAKLWRDMVYLRENDGMKRFDIYCPTFGLLLVILQDIIRMIRCRFSWSGTVLSCRSYIHVQMSLHILN